MYRFADGRRSRKSLQRCGHRNRYQTIIFIGSNGRRSKFTSAGCTNHRWAVLCRYVDFNVAFIFFLFLSLHFSLHFDCGCQPLKCSFLCSLFFCLTGFHWFPFSSVIKIHLILISVAARRVLCEIYNLKLYSRPGERTYVWFFIGKHIKMRSI